MEEIPACRKCKRTHTSMGKPVILKVRGEYAGLCTACMQFRARVAGPPPPHPGMESDTRALDFYIARRRERLARYQRPTNTPRTA